MDEKSASSEGSSGHMQKENEIKRDNLGQAKDRAQLTATSAMSMVHVALLKEVLTEGPQGNRYYHASIVLICVSLALQVLAGIIALFVSHLRVYFTRYQDDALEDICENLCCCRLMCRPKTHQPRLSGVGVGSDKVDGKDVTAGVSSSSGADDRRASFPAFFAVEAISARETEVDPPNKCCPCNVTTQIFPDFEYAMVDAYDEWRSHYTEIELDAAGSAVQITQLSESIQNARGKLQLLEQEKEQYDVEDFRKMVDEIQSQIADASEQKAKYEAVQRRAAIGQARGDILWERASAVRKNQILKRASFWQHTINYIFYVVFVLNAFITGLGISQNYGPISPTSETVNYSVANNTV